MRYCTIKTCSTKHYGIGFCHRHYCQITRYGKIINTRCEPRKAIIDGDIAKLPLGVNAKDGYAIVDKEYAWLDRYKWRLEVRGYPVGLIKRRDKKLHQMIMPRKNGFLTDHVDGNPLNNRKINLRYATGSQNGTNKTMRSDNTSGYKGVSRIRTRPAWRAYITKDGQPISLGYFKDKKEAALAYNKKATELHGEFARLNKIEE